MTRRLRWGLAVVVTGAMLLGGVPSAQAGRQEIGHYVTMGSDSFAVATVWWATRQQLAVCDVVAADLGAVCFSVAGETTMQVTLSDLSGLPVSGRVWFDGPLGRTSESFCATSTVAVPPGASRALVYVDSVGSQCGIAGGPATSGAVVATFS